jgi:heme/copper-type cytochrome/quinol oxidase subunit 2
MLLLLLRLLSLLAVLLRQPSRGLLTVGQQAFSHGLNRIISILIIMIVFILIAFIIVIVIVAISFGSCRRTSSSNREIMDSTIVVSIISSSIRSKITSRRSGMSSRL